MAQNTADSQHRLSPKGLRACSNEHEFVQALIPVMEEVAKPNKSSALETPKETRQRLLRTLKAIGELVETLTDKFVEDEDERIIYVQQSCSSGLINRLINALEELQDGIVDPILKPQHQASKTLTAYEVKQRENACTLYMALRNHRLNKEERCRRVARAFNVSPKDILTWVSNRRKQAGSKRRRK